MPGHAGLDGTESPRHPNPIPKKRKVNSLFVPLIIENRLVDIYKAVLQCPERESNPHGIATTGF